VAIGQAIDGELLAHVCVDIERGCFKTDPVTLETSVKGILPEEITLPVRPASSRPSPQGKRAVESMERYLQGKDLRVDRFDKMLKPVPEELLPSTTIRKERTGKGNGTPAELRTGNLTRLNPDSPRTTRWRKPNVA